MKKKYKNRIEKIKNRFLLAFGVFLCCFPTISSICLQKEQDSLVQTYTSDVHSLSKEELNRMYKEAQTYNQILYATQGTSLANVDYSQLSEENYKKQLCVTASGIMANIEIPCVDVSLPIYHGTDDDALNNGVGHLKESSLPVGGKSTRSILTGHRGLPTAKLFTRLDELEKGDLFYIHVCNKTLAYKIMKIEIIKPEELDKLDIEEGKDLVTLVTCTPYGINTKRLIVTGERIPYNKKTKQSIKKKKLSIRECTFILLPLLLMFMIFTLHVVIKRKNRKEKNPNVQS